MTTTEQRLRAALERAVAIVEANPLSYNPEGRLYRIGDIAREALAAAPEDEGWRPTDAQREAYYELFRIAPGTETWAMAGIPSFDQVWAALSPPLDLHEEGKR